MEYIIYKITINDFIYVSSTKNFIMRKYRHKCNNEKNIDLKLYKIIRENGGWENCEMIPIEKLKCETKTDARIREEHWRIELNANLNSQRAYKSHEVHLKDKKEYYYKNKEPDNLKSKEYRESHREEIANYKKE